MNIVSKGLLTSMALALDFAAGNAIEQVLDLNWTDTPIQQEAVSLAATVPSKVQGMEIGEPQTGGGVCKPTEHSVMVMEIDRMAPEQQARPRHVCIKALSGVPEFLKQIESLPAFTAGE